MSLKYKCSQNNHPVLTKQRQADRYFKRRTQRTQTSEKAPPGINAAVAMQKAETIPQRKTQRTQGGFTKTAWKKGKEGNEDDGFSHCYGDDGSDGNHSVC